MDDEGGGPVQSGVGVLSELDTVTEASLGLAQRFGVARVQAGDLLLDDIRTDDVVADLGEAGSDDQAYVAGADDCDVHGALDGARLT